MDETTPRPSDAHPRIAIIGAGVSGLALGVKLLRAGIGDFDIFEADSRLGGTWWQNQYPGAAVDVHSALYQFSFANHHWRRTHGLQHELLDYLENTAKRFGVDKHIPAQHNGRVGALGRVPPPVARLYGRRRVHLLDRRGRDRFPERPQPADLARPVGLQGRQVPTPRNGDRTPWT